MSSEEVGRYLTEMWLTFRLASFMRTSIAIVVASKTTSILEVTGKRRSMRSKGKEIWVDVDKSTSIKDVKIKVGIFPLTWLTMTDL